MARSNTKNLKKRVVRIAAKLKSKVVRRPLKAKVTKKAPSKKVLVKKNKKVLSPKKALPKLKAKVVKKSKANIISNKKSVMTSKKPAKKIISSKASAKLVKVVKGKAPVIRKDSTSGPLGILPYKLQKDEEYMGDKQLRHFEQILNLWKKQLMQEVDRTIYDMQGVVNYPDQVDRASQEEEFSLKLRERDRERKLLKKIDEALLRIKNGEYGYCDECGAEIGIRRLEARPIATQCIECKTIAELREKQIGG